MNTTPLRSAGSAGGDSARNIEHTSLLAYLVAKKAPNKCNCKRTTLSSWDLVREELYTRVEGV